LSPGGTGGKGGKGGVIGGDGGTGEGPTVIFDHSTKKMYVCEVSPVPFAKSFLNKNSVHLGQGLITFPVLDIFQAELCLDSKKFCISGWNILLIRRTDSMSYGAFIMKLLGAGSYMISNSSNGRPHQAHYGSKESASQFHSVPIPCLIIGCSWYWKECTKVFYIATTHIICC
jgi:hypothetical protein